MTGICVGKLRHECPDGGGNGKPLQVYLNEDGSYSGFCFRCGQYVEDPFEGKAAPPPPKKKTKEQIEEELREIHNEWGTQSVRSIRKEILEYLGIKIGVSETDGMTPNVAALPYTKKGELVSYKIATLNLKPKRIYSVGDQSDVDLFGWEQAITSGQKRLYITEGELDTAALIDILKRNNRKEEYRDVYPAVVSLPHGAGAAAKDLAKLLPAIRQYFKEVVLVFDRDEPGRQAVEEVCKIAPDFLSAELPCKDANECLEEGHIKTAFAAVMFRGAKPKNSRIIMGSSLRDVAKKRPEFGLSWPWQGLTDLTRGIRRKETYYLGAGTKMGKSEVVNAIGDHLIRHHDLPVMFCKPEEDAAKTYKLLVGKAAGRIFHDPSIPFDEEAFDQAEKLIGDKAIIVDSYQFVDWDTLKGDIAYCVKGEKVKDIIIDPITCFTNQMSSSEANEFLVGMTAELAAMSKDMDFTSYIFCHLKAPEAGPPHERGGKVLSTQFAGSRSMMRACHMMIGLEGNKDPDLSEEDRNMRTLVLLEDRTFGQTGRIPLFWDKTTGLFTEVR